MRSGVIAQKVGMTRVYNDAGEHVPVTVLRMESCQVVAQRTKEKNGYTAVQLGVGLAKVKNTSKAHARPFRDGFRRAEDQARRVPRLPREPSRRGRRDHRRAFRRRPEGRRHRHDHRQGLPGRHQAAPLQGRPRDPRQLGVAPHARLDRPAPGPRQGVQGQEDGRPYGHGSRHHAERRDRLDRHRPRPDPDPRCGSGLEGCMDPGPRRGQERASGQCAEAGRDPRRPDHRRADHEAPAKQGAE